MWTPPGREWQRERGRETRKQERERVRKRKKKKKREDANIGTKKRYKHMKRYLTYLMSCHIYFEYDTAQV